jgi:hypothetical protein
MARVAIGTGTVSASARKRVPHRQPREDPGTVRPSARAVLRLSSQLFVPGVADWVCSGDGDIARIP